MNTDSNRTRQLNSLFRFDDERNGSTKTHYVFSHGHTGDSGIFAAPAAALLGFVRSNKKPASVREDSNGSVVGRLLELTEAELARLDMVAERQGDYHRFKALVNIPLGGFEVEAWVYQLRSDETPLTALTSSVCDEIIHSLLPN